MPSSCECWGVDNWIQILYFWFAYRQTFSLMCLSSGFYFKVYYLFLLFLKCFHQITNRYLISMQISCYGLIFKLMYYQCKTLLMTYNHGNYIGLATLFQIDQATLYADNELKGGIANFYFLV